ncbi:MAG: isoprenyl transferase [Desulfobacterales bacterium]|nr:isoprenyl transferase [Desulfobacterales bacterium]
MNFSSLSIKSADLDSTKIPKHIAIIMDGNGRWAKRRLLNRIKGHEKGAETVKTVVRVCQEIGIAYLTLFAFSTENWQRPKNEVMALMALLKKFVIAEQKDLIDKGIRLNAIGELGKLPEDVYEALMETINRTKNNCGLQINLALSYGGRDEIVHMVRRIAEKVHSGAMIPESISMEVVSDHLYTQGIPDPDLLIRTSGEIRISNFLLWQIAYSEICVTETLWPDFGEGEFLAMIKNFQGRERRFGKV